MPATTRYFFKKEDKLKSRKAIDQLFAKGKSFSNFPFRVIWMAENKNAILQLGVTVGSKHFKKATDRNRIKRLMREGWRLQKSSLTEKLKEHNRQLSVFMIYVGNDIPEYQFVFEKITVIINRLIKFTDATA